MILTLKKKDNDQYLRHKEKINNQEKQEKHNEQRLKKLIILTK